MIVTREIDCGLQARELELAESRKRDSNLLSEVHPRNDHAVKVEKTLCDLGHYVSYIYKQREKLKCQANRKLLLKIHNE